MVVRIVAVDDSSDDPEPNDDHVPERERARYIRGAERDRLIMELAREEKTITQLAPEYDRDPGVLSKFKWRNKREILEMKRILREKLGDLVYAEVHYRIALAHRHLTMVEDQIREMLEAADPEEGDPVPLDMKEFRGLMDLASKIRKEIREETKPTLTLGQVEFTPPKGYPGWDMGASFDADGGERQ